MEYPHRCFVAPPFGGVGLGRGRGHSGCERWECNEVPKCSGMQVSQLI